LFNEKLREWENYYNYDRPHGALDGQTPYERLVKKARAGLSALAPMTVIIRTSSPRLDSTALG
jgi:hypothetical protein